MTHQPRLEPQRNSQQKLQSTSLNLLYSMAYHYQLPSQEVQALLVDHKRQVLRTKRNTRAFPHVLRTYSYSCTALLQSSVV